MKKKYAAAIALAFAVIFIITTSSCIGLPLFGGSPLPEGNYVTERGSEWMHVADDTVIIGRDESSFSVLPNRSNVKLFDKNDLSRAHPQYLRKIDNDTVEWIRKASGPAPQYKIIFHRK